MLFTLSSISQDLEKHQRENRILLIFTDDKNADDVMTDFNTILSPEKLFTIIDGMPMRKLELKR